MQVFKSALKIFFRHPIYIAVYAIALSFMAVFIGLGSVSNPQSEFTAEHPNIAIIDHDGSDLSKGLSAFLGDHANIVEIEDSRLAMQNATAQNQAAYIAIIPEGFGENFISSIVDNKAVPVIETVVSYESISANMMNNLVDEYLNTAQLYIASDTAKIQSEIVEFTSSAMANSANVTTIQRSESAPVSQQWSIYMMFASYTIMLSIIVCVGMVFAAFNQTDTRRRNISSPLSSLSMNLQIAAVCVVIALLIWAWISILGLAVFGKSLAGVDPIIIGLSLLSLLAFSVVSLAIGFLLGQLTTSDLALNAAGNITGLVFSFLGGIWVPIEFLGDGVKKVAHFLPTFYYNDAIDKAANLQEFSRVALTPIFTNMGITLLFAVAIFAIALAAGRLRIQSAEAGGNAAAARARS